MSSVKPIARVGSRGHDEQTGTSRFEIGECLWFSGEDSGETCWPKMKEVKRTVVMCWIQGNMSDFCVPKP